MQARLEECVHECVCACANVSMCDHAKKLIWRRKEIQQFSADLGQN